MQRQKNLHLVPILQLAFSFPEAAQHHCFLGIPAESI